MLTVLYKSGLPGSSHFRKPCKLRNGLNLKELLSFPRSAKPKMGLGPKHSLSYLLMRLLRCRLTTTNP